jgi:hypothetical protein
VCKLIQRPKRKRTVHLLAASRGRARKSAAATTPAPGYDRQTRTPVPASGKAAAASVTSRVEEKGIERLLNGSYVFDADSNKAATAPVRL